MTAFKGALMITLSLFTKAAVTSLVRSRFIAMWQTVTLETQQEQLHPVPFSLAPRFENHLHLNVLFNMVKNALLLQTFRAQTGLKSFRNLSKTKITLPLKEQYTVFISGLSAVIWMSKTIKWTISWSLVTWSPPPTHPRSLKGPPMS